MNGKKIFTLADARDERVRADLQQQAAPKVRGTRLWLVADARGVTVGQCQTRKAAEAFKRDALNAAGWTIRQVRF